METLTHLGTWPNSMQEFVMFSSPAFFFNLPILISCQSIPPACANFTSYLNIALGLVFEITPSSFQTRNITVPDSCFLDTWPTPSGCGQQKYKDPPIPVSVLSKLLVHKSTYAWTPNIPSGKGTAPVRKMTTWLTLSASCVRSRHHTATKNNPPNVRRPRISIFRAMSP